MHLIVFDVVPIPFNEGALALHQHLNTEIKNLLPTESFVT